MVLFLSVSADQLGLPVPSVPVLLAMGALSGSGEFSLAIALPLAVLGCLVGDLSWYELGRRRGPNVLLFSKFVPGLSLVAPPLAAMFRMRIRRFLAWDAAGSLIWAGAFIGAGFLFRGKMEAGEDLTVVDLRHPLEFDADRVKVPGALHMLPEELAKRHGEIRRDRDVVLYCTCPNEATSAMMTLRLHRLGITRVRPLSGGFDAWVEGGFPLETKTAAPSLFEESGS